MPKLNQGYIAWVRHEGDTGWASVALGGEKEVMAKAAALAATPLWRDYAEGDTHVRITRGARQLFVTAYIIRRTPE
jgi:hypothetical protein